MHGQRVLLVEPATALTSDLEDRLTARLPVAVMRVTDSASLEWAFEIFTPDVVLLRSPSAEVEASVRRFAGGAVTTVVPMVSAVGGVVRKQELNAILDVLRRALGLQSPR